MQIAQGAKATFMAARLRSRRQRNGWPRAVARAELPDVEDPLSSLLQARQFCRVCNCFPIGNPCTTPFNLLTRSGSRATIRRLTAPWGCGTFRVGIGLTCCAGRVLNEDTRSVILEGRFRQWGQRQDLAAVSAAALLGLALTAQQHQLCSLWTCPDDSAMGPGRASHVTVTSP